MPKATWGSGDQALSAADIDGAKSNEFSPYSGPIPPAGLYRFIVKQMKQGLSAAGNPKLQIVMELDGTWKSNHKKFDGCPLFDNMPVMKSTAFRVKAFCEAFGISSKQFQTGIITDESGKVTKLSIAGDPNGLEVYVNVSKRPATDQYQESLQLNGTGYLPISDDEVEDQNEDESDDEGDDDEPPF
jgi:hypothetical protein